MKKIIQIDTIFQKKKTNMIKMKTVLLKQLEVKIIFVEAKMVTILMELLITLQYGKGHFLTTRLGIFMKDR